MELRDDTAAQARPGPSLHGLMEGLLNIPGTLLAALVAASVGCALVAVPPVPLLALIIFSVLWAVTLIALFGAAMRGMERRRHHQVAH